MSDPNPIPDATPEDSYSDGDHLIDWSQVDTVAEQIAAIQAIEDPAARLEAAKAWARELGS